MSGSNAAADAIRTALLSESQTITTLANLFASGTETNFSNNGTANTYLQINNTTGATTSPLFLSTGFSFIENVNDTSTVVAAGTDATTTAEYYQGDAGGQTFATGAGDVFVAMTGFGNTVELPSVGGGTYTVATGLFNAAGDLSALAPAASVGGVEAGNTIVAGAGQIQIAAGLGANGIFLGSGNDTVASEGRDTVFGGSGTSAIVGTTDSTGSILFYGAGDSTAGGGSNTVYGNTESVTVYGGSGAITAYGGSAGNNVLVGGAGTAVLVGNGANDTLAAGSKTSTLVAGSGNETLFGGGAGSNTSFFAGGVGSTDSIIAGGGANYVQFGAGASTVFGAGSSDLYGAIYGGGGGNDAVVGFNTGSDYLLLQGFDSSVSAASVLANDVTVSGGNTSITLSDNSHIELFGVTNLTASNILISPGSGTVG